MLGFFRRIINSKAGVVVTFVVLGVIAFAFAAGDVTGLAGSTSGGITGDTVARVGDAKIGPAELRARVDTELQGFRQQQPTLDMASFVAQGGLDGTLQRMVTAAAFEQFGRDQGMVVSKRSIDGQIASIPALQDAAGRFDPAIYRRLLADRKLTDAQVRGDIARDTFGALLTGPVVGAHGVPEQLAIPYASLQLERRTGEVGIVPVDAVPAGPAPTDAELQAYYQRNIARFSLPERRVARYALVAPDQVRSAAAATDAEIAQAYAADRGRYAAAEKRTVTQVVVADQAGANALAASVRGGTAIAAAARAAGLEPSTQTGLDKPAYAILTSPAVADAVFGAAQGAVVGPVRGALGFVVAHVDRVEQVAARPLDAVRGEIAKTITTRKTAEALSDLQNQVNDALAGNATFDEVIGDRKLAARTTPALTAAGTDPAQPSARPDPQLAPILAAAFASAEGDAPQLLPIGQDGSFAVVALGRIVAAAPRPLAEVRQAVSQGFVAERRRQAARRLAAQVVAAVGRGTPLARALADARLPGPRPLAAVRGEVGRAPAAAQAPLALLFGLQPGRARLAPATDGSAFAVVRLDRVERHEAARDPAAIRGARGAIAGLVGREYAEQFIRAIRNDLGVKTDAAALARVRADLLGQGQSNN